MIATKAAIEVPYRRTRRFVLYQFVADTLWCTTKVCGMGQVQIFPSATIGGHLSGIIYGEMLNSRTRVEVSASSRVSYCSSPVLSFL